MKQIPALIIAGFLALSPAHADETGRGEVAEGMNLMQEGGKLLLRGLLGEMQPALDDLQSWAEEMGPILLELKDMIGDLGDYHAPEVLPNGDIIIRRKAPLELQAPEGGKIEL